MRGFQSFEEYERSLRQNAESAAEPFEQPPRKGATSSFEEFERSLSARARPVSSNPYSSPHALPDSTFATTLQGPLNPWVSIWTQPRATTRYLVETNPTYMIFPLSAVYGIGEILDKAASNSMGDTVPMPVILGIALVCGPLGGILRLFMAGLLFRPTGSWLGGVATAEQIRGAYAWAQLPSTASTLLWLPLLAIFGADVFSASTYQLEHNALLPIAMLGLSIIEVFLGGWSFVLTCKCLAEVHRFSAWRAFASIMISGMIVVLGAMIPIALFVVALGMS